MSNEKGGYVLIDINPLAGPTYTVQDNDTVTSKHAFEILQKLQTGVMPVCTKLGIIGITFKPGTGVNFNSGTFQMPRVRNLPNGISILIFTGFRVPYAAGSCLATLTITPSAEVDENGNPLEEATAVWKLYADAQ